MKTVLALAIIITGMSQAIACDNICWRNTNEQAINNIIAWGHSHHPSQAEWEHMRQVLDAICDRGFPVTQEERDFADRWHLRNPQDCRRGPVPTPTPTSTPRSRPTPVPTPRPTATPKPIIIKVEAVPCWHDGDSRLRFIGPLAGLRIWIDGKPVVHDEAGRVIVTHGFHNWFARMIANGKVVSEGRIFSPDCSHDSPSSPTPTPTTTTTPHASPTPTSTPTATATSTPSATSSPTVRPSSTPTATATATPTATVTATATPTATATGTATASPTATATATATSTISPTATPTASATASSTATATPTATATATATPTCTPTTTPTATATPTCTPTPTPTATATCTPSPTASPSCTPYGHCVLSTIQWRDLYPNWPASAFPLPIGTNTYTAEQCLQILKYPGDHDDGLNPLAKELIAEKLNESDGAPHFCIDETVREANARIMSLVPKPIGNGFILRSTIENLIIATEEYNKGQSCCAYHCD